MSQLILINKESGFEIGRRAMHADERYTYYKAQGEQIVFQGCCYRLLTVAWRLPDEDCVCSVASEPCPPEYFCED
jgi:hypothetical protein